MEARFSHDFSQVRVHTDERAAESARVVNAKAYTVGCNVVFGLGRYAPATRDGSRLLAHELAHTIQQRSPSGAPQPADSNGRFETSATAAGDAAADGHAVAVSLPACGVGLARAPEPELLEEAFNDSELVEELERLSERLKERHYFGGIGT